MAGANLEESATTISVVPLEPGGVSAIPEVSNARLPGSIRT